MWKHSTLATIKEQLVKMLEPEEMAKLTSLIREMTTAELLLIGKPYRKPDDLCV